MKRCLIIFPPQCRPFHPPLGPAMLKTSILSAGHSCMNVDLNVLWYRKILTRPILEKAKVNISNIVSMLDGKALQGLEAVQYKRCASALLRADYVIENIDKALIAIKSENFYHIKNFVWSLKLLEEALDLYSSQFECLEFGLSQLRTKYSTATSAALVSATKDIAANPFIGELLKLLLPTIENYRPDVIGISIMLDEQLIPSCTLANELKEIWSYPLIAGGAMITRLKDLIRQSEVSNKWFDKYFFYESENSLVEYLNSLEPPNKQSGPCFFEEIIPSFSDYFLDDYFLPQRILPYQGTRGCSFGKCNYCSHYKTYGTFLKGNPIKSAYVLHELSRKYCVKYFYLLDEALEPSYARKFCSELLRIGADIRFMVFARSRRGWTKELITLLADAGCRRLILGIDALTNHIQALMNKNTDLDYTKKIISWCSDVGISLQINIIVGYPGESIDEVMNSLLFIKENKKVLTTIGSSFAYTPFYLVRGAAWKNMPITVLESTNKDLAVCFRYLTEHSITMQNSRQIAMSLQKQTDDILDASRRYPLLREFAFLYTDYAYSTHPARNRQNENASWPAPPKKTDFWLKHNLEQTIQHFETLSNALPETENDYLSNSWRVANETDFRVEKSDGLTLHRMQVIFHEKTIEMPIQRLLSL